MRVRRPQLADRVIYRGREGLQASRAAIVTATAETIDVRGVEAGQVPPLSSPTHVHLHVFTPGPDGWFSEFDVSHGAGPGQWQWPGQ